MRTWVLTVAGLVIASASYVALRPSRIDAVGTLTTSQAEIAVTSVPAPLRELAQRDLAASPDEAPAMIALVGAQGGTHRVFAGETLARWLRAELGRADRDAQGNVVSIVEALGAVGGDAAIGSLADVLDRGGEDIALQTLATQQLVALGAGQAAVDRYAARLRALSAPGTDFERQLRAEGLAAAANQGREPTE